MVDVAYHEIFQTAPCVLPPAVLTSLFKQQPSDVVLANLAQASYMESSLAAEEWVAAFEAMLSRSEDWPLMDLVWQRIEELSEDAAVAKRVRCSIDTAK